MVKLVRHENDAAEEKGEKIYSVDLRMAYKVASSSRNDFRTRTWETIRTSALLETGALAASGGVLAANFIPEKSVLLLGVLLILLGAYLSCWTYWNVRREQGLLYQEEFAMYQIEKILGLHMNLSEDMKWHPNIDKIFAQKHTDCNFKCAPPKYSCGDPIADWAEGKLEKQSFSNEIILGLLSIFFIPMFGIGLYLIVISIMAYL